MQPHESQITTDAFDSCRHQLKQINKIWIVLQKLHLLSVGCAEITSCIFSQELFYIIFLKGCVLDYSVLPDEKCLKKIKK